MFYRKSHRSSVKNTIQYNKIIKKFFPANQLLLVSLLLTVFSLNSVLRILKLN